MEIKIMEMRITAFKGIRQLTVSLDGQSADIYGRNGTGKTSLYDAYLWLLFGKDSKGVSKFDVKPLDENSRPKTGTDTEVEAMLDVDGKPVKLRRVLHEKWKIMPGSADPLYVGDETLCYIDDVPVKLEKDYQPYIAGLVGDEEQFKLLSIHGYFMTRPWEQRRRYLVDAAGGSADEEILARPEFASIPDILQGKRPEEAKKRLRDQLKRVQVDLDSIPDRLDELQRMMPQVSEKDVQEANELIDRMKKELALINSQLDGTEDTFQRAANLQRRVSSLASSIERRKIELDAPIKKAKREFSDRLENARNRKISLEREAERLRNDMTDIDRDISTLQAKREKLLADWHKAEEKTFTEPALSTVCPCCGQPLPDAQIADAREKARKEFNARRDSEMGLLEAQGKSTAETILRLQGEKKGVQESLDRKTVFIQEVANDLAALETADAAILPDHFDYEQDEQYNALIAQMEELREEVERPVSDAARNALLSQRDRVQDVISEARSVHIRMEQADEVKRRIEKLEENRMALGQEVIDIQGQISLLADYTTACCSVMEGRINAMFHNIQWQLYEFQKDGAVKDCCNATLNGVDYTTNLNNGARINAGIEIIRVLSRSLGVIVPCFVDNAEAVNNLAYSSGQMIRLRVSEAKELTMLKEG